MKIAWSPNHLLLLRAEPISCVLQKSPLAPLCKGGVGGFCEAHLEGRSGIQIVVEKRRYLP